MPPVFIAAALVAAEVITVGTAIMTAISYGISQYQQRRAERKARDAYNDSLKDRLVMTATVDRARSRCYGRVRNVDGVLFKATWGPKKSYYTWVVALCGHEIDGIEQVMFNDVPVTLDANGRVLNAPWNRADNALQTPVTIPAGSNSVTLPYVPADGSVKVVAETSSGDQVIPATVSGSTVTVSDGGFMGVVKRVVSVQPKDYQRAQVRLYNGGDGQDLSNALAADMPDLIVPGKHRFAGMACLRVDLFYDQEAFANGPPNPVTAIFRGAKVYDWRLNRLSNPHYDGATGGLPGTGLQLWTTSGAVTAAVVGSGVEAGQRFIDVRIQGSASGTSAFAYLSFAAFANRPAAAPGQTWHAGVYCRRIAGAAGVFLPQLVLRGLNAAFDQVNGVTASLDLATFNSATALSRARSSVSLALTDPAVTMVESRLMFVVNNGETLDLTVRVGLATLSQGVDAVRWTENPALIAADWSLYPNGGALGPDEIWRDDFTARANECDVLHAFTSRNQEGATTTTTRPLYTCNLALGTDGDPIQALDEICQTMAGAYAWPGGRLTIDAGVWRAPSGTITSDWISDQAAIEAVSDAPLQDRVNVITPIIADAAKAYVEAPMPRVAAEAYIALDGAEEPREERYLGVSDADHAAHIAGVHLRQPRAAATYTLPLKLLGLQCKLFETWSLNIPELGLTGQPFKLVSWRLDLSKALVLTTWKANPASIYDPDAEFRREDALPNNALPNPFSVPELGALTLESGTEHLLERADGSVISRLFVKWPAVQNEAVLNHAAGIELRCGLAGADPATWITLAVPGSDTQAYFDQVQDRRAYAVIARCRNRLVGGKWSLPAVYVVVGKTQPPAAVQGFSLQVIPGALRGRRTRSAEPDWAGSFVKIGPTEATAVLSDRAVVDRDGFLITSPYLGPTTVWIADVDFSGNVGPWASASINVDNRALVTAGGALNRNPACDDPTAWVLSPGVQLASGANWPGAVGTSYLRCASGVDQLAWSAETIPLDPNRRYALTASLAAAAGNNRNNYLVVDMFDVAGNRVTSGGWGGTYSGYTFGGLVPGDGTGRQYGQVFGKNTPRPIPANVAYCRIGVWFQYSAGSGAAEQLAQDVRLQEVVGWGAIQTDNVANGAITDNGGVTVPVSTSPGFPGGSVAVLGFLIGPTLTLNAEDVLNFDINGFHDQGQVMPVGEMSWLSHFTVDAWVTVSGAETGAHSYSSTISAGVGLDTRIPIRHSMQLQPGAGTWNFQLMYRIRSYDDSGINQPRCTAWSSRGEWAWKKTKR